MHEFDDVRVGDLAESPRVRVDHMGLDAPVCEGGNHFNTEWSGLDDDGLLHGIEPLVPLHRRADVLDVVEPVEVTARYSRVRVAEARRDDERVIGNGLSIEHLNGLLRSINRRDRRVVADVNASIDIRLLVCEEQRLEARDLLAVHERYAARAVGNVLKLGEDDDLGTRVDGLCATRGSEAATTAADHNNALTHGKLQSEMAGKRTQ